MLGSWGLAGASVGSAVGGVLQVTQGMAGASSWAGTLGIGGGALLGAVALVIERRQAEQRPLLLDARGRGARPLHGVLFAIPVLAAIPALLVLGVVATIGMGHIAPFAAFGVTAGAVAWAGVRVWSTHRFTSALEDLERGDVEQARERLAALATSLTASRSARTAARLNLGMMALQEGQGADALLWYDAIGSGGAMAWALAGRALALLLVDRADAAATALSEAVASPAARQVQEQLDAVRVLLVWRTEGAEAAKVVGERLASPAATPLHRALLAALRAEEGSRDDEVMALLASGLGRAVPELATLR